MKSILGKFCILALMLLGLPLLGIILSRRPIAPYLAFPPRTLYVQHAPFSWLALIGYCLFIIAVILPFVIKGMKSGLQLEKAPLPSLPFPWWGYLGVIFGIVAWVVAWNRFPWIGEFQMHTFTPLWIAYIITINALTYGRTGHCMLLDRTRLFLMLFPVSAVFWWFFEYLNRFVQNWYYVGGDFSPLTYFFYATLPYSTVLPAVMGTRDWLLSFFPPEGRLQNLFALRVSHPNAVAWAVLLAAGVGLTGIGIWPNYLFALLWVSPLLIIVSLQAIFGERHIFSDLTHGHWRLIISSALAALICGFFWEMWNFYSLAKWKYNIPFVHRLLIFEMPILGFAGYLPFGVQCTVIVDMMQRRGRR